jgi:hypothetical protein
MDCDTTGVEPDFALVKFKKLAGGGYFKIAQPVPPAPPCQPRLSPRKSRHSQVRHGHLTLHDAPASTTDAPAQGLHQKRS